MKRKLVCRQAHEHVAHCFKGLKGKCDCPVCVKPKATPPHTPEPFRVIPGADYKRDAWHIMAGERHVAIVYDENEARRFAACWNACAGISTEALEGLLPEVKTELGRQRALWQIELESLRKDGHQDDGMAISAAKENMKRLSAILAKFEGK